MIQDFILAVMEVVFPVWDALASAVMAVVTAVPMWGARAIVVGLLAGLAVWSVLLPKDYAFKGMSTRVWYLDVRLWAVIVIALEMIPYLVF